MPSKKFLELQEYDDASLATELSNTQTEYQKMNFDNAVKGLENPLVLREVRRDIARLKTELRRREIAAMSEADLAKRSKIRNRRKQGK